MTQDEFITELKLRVEFEFDDKIRPKLREDMSVFADILFMAHKQDDDEVMKVVITKIHEMIAINFKHMYLTGALSGMTLLAQKSGEIGK